MGDILVPIESEAHIDLPMVDRIDTRTPVARVGLGLFARLAVVDELFGLIDKERRHIVTPSTEVNIAHWISE